MPVTPSRQKTGILRKAMRQLLLLATVIILALSFITFLFSRSLLTQHLLVQADAQVGHAEDLIGEALNLARAQSALFASQARMQRLLGSTGDEREWESWVAAQRLQQPALEGMALYDGSGRAIAAYGQEANYMIAPQGARLLQRFEGGTWRGYNIAVPVANADGSRGGTLVLRYDAAPLLASIRAPLSSLGQTAEMFLVYEEAGKLQLLHIASDGQPAYTLSLGDTYIQERELLPAALAVRGEEGVVQAQDHRGQDVLTAYRFLPALGWGLVVQVDRGEVLTELRPLARALVAVGAILLAFALLLAYLLAREFTDPLRALAGKVEQLGPGRWKNEPAIRTGDEVELVDEKLGDMAQRLQRVYDHLEEAVQERTEKLRQQFELERTILESIEYAVVTVSIDGKVTAANPACVQLLGYAQHELVGAPATDVLVLQDRDGALSDARHPVRVCLTQKQTFHPDPAARLSIRRKDGSWLPVMLVASPLQHDDKAFGTVVIFQDVASERQMDELKSEFIALASHQLRTPISILRWHTDLLAEEDGFSKTQEASLAEIRTATSRMAHLMDALLQVAQLEGDGLQPKIEDVDLHAFLRSMLSEMKEVALKANVTMQADAPKEKLRTKTDVHLLGIALQNILMNALKYSKPGSTVTVGLRRTRAGIDLFVEDQGMGVPAREQKHLFEKFFRAQNVRQIDTDGSGLGLYITRMILEGLGGTVSFMSEEGKGSTFTLHLPRVGKH